MINAKTEVDPSAGRVLVAGGLSRGVVGGEPVVVVAGELEVQGGRGIVEMVDVGCDDHRRDDDGVAEDPRERDLSHSTFVVVGDLFDGVDDQPIVGAAEQLSSRVDGRSLTCCSVRSGESSFARGHQGKLTTCWSASRSNISRSSSH